MSRSNAAHQAMKLAVQAELRRIVEGRMEIGLTTAQRHLSNAGPDISKLDVKGLFLAKMLNAIGWQRDGYIGTGYDRTPRYTPLNSIPEIEENK